MMLIELSWQFYSFSTLKLSSHSLLPSMVCNGGKTVNLIENLLYMSCFSLLSRFSLYLTFDSFIMLYLGMDLFKFILLEICRARIIFLITFEMLLPIMFSNILLDFVTPSSFSETLIIYLLLCLMVSYRSPRTSSFSFSIFFLL